MKIRLISDLHCDVNKTYEFGFNNLEDQDLLLIAGDIAGSYDIEEKFLVDKLNVSCPIIAIGGNHLGYNYLFNKDAKKPLQGTKEWSINYLRKNGEDLLLYYLENDYVIINNILIFGGTMYTDFSLYGNQITYGSVAERYMNDFRYVYTNDGDTVRPVTSADYITWYNIFRKKLKKAIKLAEKNNYNVIILTHFAPSKKSISKKYNGGIYKELNPAYVTDLSDYIKRHECIKIWCHGHMHDSFDYSIGQCRVICSPYGYYHEHFRDPDTYKGSEIYIKDIGARDDLNNN